MSFRSTQNKKDVRLRVSNENFQFFLLIAFNLTVNLFMKGEDRQAFRRHHSKLVLCSVVQCHDR
jgi:hypothetical protein